MKRPDRILVVDPDERVREILRIFFSNEKCECTTFEDYDSLLGYMKHHRSDCLVLNVNRMADVSWKAFLTIRKKLDVPIVILSERRDTADVIYSLNQGADDYIRKPFDPKEVVARVRAVLRRSRCLGTEETLKVGGLTINMESYVIEVNGERKSIPPREIELLHFLVSNMGRTFSREQLLEQVWGFDFYGDSRTVDVHIKRIRSKIEVNNSPWRIKTVWGVGYKFEYQP